MDLEEMKQNYTMARETALLGQYETAVIYYQACIAQIVRYLPHLSDQLQRKQEWLNVIAFRVT